MNKILRCLSMSIGLAILLSVSALSQTVQIGAGLSTTGSSGITPYGTLWEDGRVQYIILASELSSAGLTPSSNITALGFNVTSSSGDPLNGFSIKMGHTALGAHPGGVLPTSTTCFSQAVSAPTLGWNTYTFATSFIWNGSDNIVVEVCFDNASWNGSSTVQSDDYAFNAYAGQYDDGQVGCSMTTGLTSGPGFTRPAMQITYISGSACTAPPTAGMALASANPVCPGTNVTLSITGGTMGSGQTYQWQSSPDGITFTDISGATNSTYNATINSNIFFRAVVTCSAQSDTTSIENVTLQPFFNCYCASNATSTADSKIDRVKISNIDNISSPTACETYTNVSSPVGVMFQGISYPILVRSGTCGGSYTRVGRVFIDYNQNGIFDLPQEAVFAFGPTTASTPAEDFTGVVNIPVTASTGITRMRVVLLESSDPNSVMPCGTYTWGETEDYMVNIAPQPANDAGIAEIISPSNPPTGGCSVDDFVVVSLTTIGTATLTSATIHVSVNGTTITSYNWAGSITSGQTTTVNLGAVSLNDGDTVLVWVTNPNGVADEFAFNDSMSVIGYDALNGVYTVYGTTPDFATMNDAIEALELRGICGDVFFNVRAGTYNEQVLVGPYPSTGSYTVTIQSESLNASDVRFEYMATSTALNYVFGFNQSQNIILNRLTLANTSTTFSGVVRLLGGNNNIAVQYCNVYSDSLATTTTTNKIAIGSVDGLDNGTRIEHNIIIGGSYGIYLAGPSVTEVESGLLVAYNTFRRYSAAAIVGLRQTGPAIKQNNIQSHSSNTNTNIFHISLEDVLNGAEVTGNLISGDQGGFGINLLDVDAQPGSPSLIANNFVYMGATGSPTNSHGIAVQECANVNIVFNSVHTRATTATAAGIRIYNGQSSGITLLNNNIVNAGSGFALNSESALYLDIANHNNYFTSSANFVRVGTNMADLSALQTATGKELNSLSVDPMFNGADLHTCRVELDNAGIPVAGVTHDFDQDTRNTSTPDIGADEFLSSANFTLGADLIKCPSDSVWLGAEQIESASYYWSPYFQNTSGIYATQPGTYIVQIIHACGISVDSIVVANYSTPSATFTYNQNFFTAAFSNNSSQATSYFWDFGDGNTSTVENPNHIYPTNGTYTVTLTAYSDCGDSSVTSQVIVINPNVAGLEDEEALQLQVYPNPSEGLFAVALAHVVSNQVWIDIYDLSGRLIHQSVMGSATNGLSTMMDITGQAAGTYLMKVRAGDYQRTVRIIIK